MHPSTPQWVLPPGAVSSLGEGGRAQESQEATATLHSNLSAAKLSAGDAAGALANADSIVTLRPHWCGSLCPSFPSLPALRTASAAGG
jgi:hypothetical protein